MTKEKYKCTDCRKDATVGFSNFSKGKKKIIGSKERLCTKCADKRGLQATNKE